ncbi:hypothetical protein [Yersinia enterocolitica]|uniref:tail fiber/spike domain-containing protein n=1 Tax=Yersinia enterocolitica TaxID=630 RepID=UPI003D093E74
MTTIPTQNPVPSEAAVDLKFNAGKIDEFVTSFLLEYTDRLGRQHLTIEGLRDIVEKAIKEFGFITMDSFEDGATLDNSSQVLRWESNGEYYRWDGSFPKVVPAGSTPASTGGIGAGAWVSIGDASARQLITNFIADLASSADGKGDALIGVKQPFTGAVGRTQHDKNQDLISTADFGIGAGDATAKLQQAQTNGQGLLVTTPTLSLSTDVTNIPLASLGEVTLTGGGGAIIHNLAPKNKLPRVGFAYNITGQGYKLKYLQANILKNSTFNVFHEISPGALPNSVPANTNTVVCAYWRMEAVGTGTTVTNIGRLTSPVGSLKFTANFGATTGVVYVRQNVSGVQAFNNATLTATVDIEVDSACQIDFYARMRINASNDPALRPEIVDSPEIALPAGRSTIAITMQCPDVSALRGQENSQNSLEWAFRLFGTNQVVNAKVYGCSISPGTELPFPGTSNWSADSSDAAYMYERGIFRLYGFTTTAGRKGGYVNYTVTKLNQGIVTIYDMVGTPNAVTIYDPAGVATNGVSAGVSALSPLGFEVTLSGSVAAGMSFTYVVNCYP